MSYNIPVSKTIFSSQNGQAGEFVPLIRGYDEDTPKVSLRAQFLFSFIIIISCL